MVRVTGFEPAVSAPPAQRFTGLSYTLIATIVLKKNLDDEGVLQTAPGSLHPAQRFTGLNYTLMTS